MTYEGRGAVPKVFSQTREQAVDSKRDKPLRDGRGSGEQQALVAELRQGRLRQ